MGPILHRFGDMAAFMCSWPHPYSTPIFWVFQLHQIAHVGVTKGLKLFGRDIIFEVFQPVWKSYFNVTDGRTDGRRQTTYNLITAQKHPAPGKLLEWQLNATYIVHVVHCHHLSIDCVCLQDFLLCCL